MKKLIAWFPSLLFVLAEYRARKSAWPRERFLECLGEDESTPRFEKFLFVVLN